MKYQLSLAAATLGFALEALATKEFWLVERTLEEGSSEHPADATAKAAPGASAQPTPFSLAPFPGDDMVTVDNFIKNDEKPFNCDSLLSVEDWSMNAGMAKTKYNDGVDHDVWRFYAWSDMTDDLSRAQGGIQTWEENPENPNGEGTLSVQGVPDFKGHCKREDDPQAVGVRQVCDDNGTKWVFTGTLHCWVDNDPI